MTETAQNIIGSLHNKLPMGKPDKKPKLLDIVRNEIRTKHYSRKTEESYISWIKRFVIFNNKKHPIDMGKEEIQKFLSYLAVERHISASTQNQALSAILYLYRLA